MFPQYLPGRLAYAYAKLQLWTAAHRSDRILTVSETSKLDILRRFRVPADKITVVYNAIDERLSLPPTEEDVRAGARALPAEGPVRALRRQHQAAQEPRAPDRRVPRAAAGVGVRGAEARHHRRRDLEVPGAAPRRAPPQAAQARAVLRASSRSRRWRCSTGWRACSSFRRSTRGSACRRSRRCTCGTPVVTSNVSSLPEVVGDAAMLVDPYSSDVDRRRHATGPDRRATSARCLRERGMARAREFSWERSVAAHPRGLRRGHGTACNRL